MGILQNAVNQIFGTAAIATKLSPEFETKQKEFKAKQDLKSFEVISASELGSEDYLENKVEKLENIAKINPTEQNITATMGAIDELNREKQAVFEAAKEQKQKAEQKQRYEAFVKMFTEGGKWK